MMITTFDTTEDMETYMAENKYDISCTIVDRIIEMYPIEVPLLIMQWNCLEDNTEYDIECYPEHVCETLEQNMSIMIEVEDYARCSKIKKILDIEYGNE